VNNQGLTLVESIFNELLNLPKDQRENVLNLRCGNNLELKNEVLSLLNSYEETEDFLEASHPFKISDSGEFPDKYIGTHIGPYLIESEVGIGGMGIVYKGKRDDKTYEQKVAIKFLKHSFTSGYLFKSFLRERQTLANLKHPNIARLLDGGSTDDGLPYLVMEFIEGIPITDYCDKNSLTIKQRLEIFRTVCDAVQYAHQNLVVHRDIKPGNILVDEKGKPMLLDFGIAKLLDENLESESDGITKTGLWVLTPDYASPEQIKGELISTSSDVYSLGILLYQLITGHQPYKIKSSSPVAINNTLAGVELKKPSEKISEVGVIKKADGGEIKISPDVISNLRSEKNEKLRHYLKGDIDNIILKAVNKEPPRRYVSVEQFSEDIRRHLIGLPVIARSDTAGYRLSKFIKRHKVGFTFSALFALFLILSTIGISWQAKIAADERDKAKTEAVKFEKVNAFLREMLSSADPTEIGKDVKVYDVLNKASQDIEVELKGQPLIEAAARRTLGVTYLNLGEFDKAKMHLDRALNLNKEIYGIDNDETAQNFHDLALYFHWISNYHTSDSLYGLSFSIFKKVLKEPTNGLITCMNDYGILKTELGEYQAADKMLREALDFSEKLNGKNSIDAAPMLNNLALNSHYLKKLDEAEKYYLQSLEIRTRLQGEDRPEVSSTYNNLGFVALDKNDFKLAEKYFEKSYELKVNLEGNNHPNVGLALNNLAAVKFREGEYNKAEEMLRKAIRLFSKSFKEDHVWVANSYYWLGKALMEKSNYKEAESCLRKSLNMREKLLPKNHLSVFAAEGELGICLLQENKFSEAGKFLLDAYNGYSIQSSANNQATTRFLEKLITYYSKTDQPQKAAYYKIKLQKQPKN
jgi:serine/threonine-protein kinase